MNMAEEKELPSNLLSQDCASFLTLSLDVIGPSNRADYPRRCGLAGTDKGGLPVKALRLLEISFS